MDRLGDDDIDTAVYGDPSTMLAGNLLAFFMRLFRRRQQAVSLPHWLCAKCEAKVRETGSMNLGLLIGPFAALLVGMTVWFATAPLWGVVAGISTLACVILLSRLGGSDAGLAVVAVESDGVILRGLTKRAANAVLSTRTDGD